MLAFSALLAALAVVVTVVPAHPLSIERDVKVSERESDSLLLQRGFDLVDRGPIDYTENYTSGGIVQFYPSKTGFSVDWSTAEDFLVGVGWKNGSTAPLSFDGSFAAEKGTGLVSVWGWATDPLVEYYIVENYVNLTPLGTVKGTFTTDGSEYTVMEQLRVNQVPQPGEPSVWEQYYSVRTSPRSSGTVTIENHFEAWASLGMKIGSLEEQILSVAGWGGSGSAIQNIVEDTALPEINPE